MSEVVSSWLRSIAAAALVSSLSIAITPKGKVRRVLKAVCGVLVIIAVISPLTQCDEEYISMDLAEYRARAEEITGDAETSDMNLSRSIIEEELEEYILDKAEEAGAADIEVNITAEWNSDGYWYPYKVTITGNVSPSARSSLCSVIESELGIPTERQNWNGYEGD